MGKSCFKFITCASNSADHDDIGVPKSKASSGRGWSFRKRSPRHQVLSNTGISEAPLSQKLQESESAIQQHKKEICEYPDSKKEIFVPFECYSGSTVIESSGSLLNEASKNDDKWVTCDANNLDPNSCKSIAPPFSHSHLQGVEESNLTYEITESYAHELRTKSNSLSSCDEYLTLEITYSAPIQTQETGQITRIDGDIPDLENYSAEQSDSEANKYSRKASNPSFAAAQSKFKERSSADSSLILTALSLQDPGVKYILDRVSSSTDQSLRSEEMGLADNTISNASVVQTGGSECGTELSISSSLDSPDRPGIEESMPAKESSIFGSDPKYSSLLAVDSEQLQQKPDANPSGVPLKLESEATHPMKKSSPAASPTSCRTILESKKGRGEKGESSQKSWSSSGDKTSRITWEQKERQNGKRRNSFGSMRSYYHASQEPRDSSSSNSLPSYMLATASARAKAIINSSPRSSPDVHDKVIYIKKRLSLPGTDGRQGSFRIQRSLSQAQQKAEGNETHSILDRKWWQ